MLELKTIPMPVEPNERLHELYCMLEHTPAEKKEWDELTNTDAEKIKNDSIGEALMEGILYAAAPELLAT